MEVSKIKKATAELSKEAGIDIVSGKFIFDKEELVQYVPFTINKFNDNFGFGFLLPKDVPLYVGRGKDKKLVGRQQIRSPAVLTSNPSLIEPSFETEKKLKIKYITIPSELPLRIDLKTIEEYLNKKTKSPDKNKLFQSIKDTYSKFLFFQTDVWYDVHSLWDIGTYLFELFNTYPIMELRGLSGTAKSKVMQVSRLFSLNPTEIMINPSEASLFRITHTNRPTKYIDEAEKLFIYIGGTWQTSPIVELINGSYSKGSKVPRIERDGTQFKTIFYDCYSPTMVGSITGLRDATETRAITHITTKSADEDERGELEVEEHQHSQEYQNIRNELYLFALNNWKGIEEEYFNLKVENLKKRDFQLWKPLLAIAKVIDIKIYDRVLKFAEKISKQKKQDFISEGSIDYKILKKVSEELDVRNKIYIKDITKAINENSGEKVTAEKTISTHLDKLGFKEFRDRDMDGSYIEISKQIFGIIVSPLCPNLVDFSSYSSYSS